MPRLRTLVLSNTGALRTKFPWAQLTSLKLPEAHPSRYVPILVQTRNLVHCELRIYTVRDHGNVGPQQDIQLPRLESLTLIHVEGEPVTDFLPTLIVPALRNLEIPESYLAPDPVGSLTAFVSKSGCRLEELRLTGIISVPENSYRQAFPSLRQLSFDDVMDDNEEDSVDPDSSDSDSSDD
ncbi:hypothetical protein DFH06DRAFT_1446593 [Mycena polygramma]|nr:hypothetical protein DFH06DRAFT_1446593 [Mycena polygramma]